MNICFLLLTVFTIVELNCENLFDCEHDALKDDIEWTADGKNKWNHKRYWRKINKTAQTIIACGENGDEWNLPDMVALCEVENDSVLTDLTKKSLLRHARYDYVMTNSPDERGIDVALIYSPFSFRLISSYPLRVDVVKGMKPTRDILYACGELITGDTLHVFVVHSPSRSGGEHETRSFRKHVAQRLINAVDSIRSVSPNAMIVATGDFNDYTGDDALNLISDSGLTEVSANSIGKHGAKGTYRYRGRWGSLDHVFANGKMKDRFLDCIIFDAPFLLEKDRTYGGMKPRRNYLGPFYKNGFSDHLPLVARFRME